MKKSYHLNAFFVIISSIFFSNAFSQPSNILSSNPAPYCTNYSYTGYIDGIDATTLEPGNDYGCLWFTPNPEWYYFKAETVGSLELTITPDVDVDFIVYGPFTDFSDMISNSGNLVGLEVACSMSGGTLEYVNLPSMNAGEYYLMLITNFSNIPQNINIVQSGGTGSLDCSVFDQPYHLISGRAFYDFNQSGTKELDENYLPNAEIQIDPAGTTALTNLNGMFEYFVYTTDSIDYTVTANLTDWTNTNSNQIDFYLDSNNVDSTNLLFGFYPDSLYYSNTVEIINTASSCVGTNYTAVNITNNGTILNGGIVEVALDSELSFNVSDYPVDSIVGSNIYFSFDTLLPFHNLMIQLWAYPTFGMVGGDTISNSANVILIDSLSNQFMTITDSLVSPIGCSYDPNNKIALPNGAFSLDNIISPTDKIEYVINFQNTGTAAAVDVTIKDTLSTLIDISSFEFLGSSHTPIITIDSSRVVTFTFININLPDSTTNEPLSKGFVKFSVFLSLAVLPNDEVINDAAIYFDFNAPIITNTTVNILNCFVVPSYSLLLDIAQLQTNLNESYYDFVWMLDGTILPGETSNHINCTVNGVYTVIVSNLYGCEHTESFTYNSASIESNVLSVINIFPNPSENNFGIYFAETGNYQISVTDESGKLIFSDLIQESNKYTIEGNSLPAGIYFIQIKQDENVSSFYKIVKL